MKSIIRQYIRRELAHLDELTTFENAELGAVRTLLIDGEPYFAGKDVAEILGYTNPQKAIRDHVDDEDKTVNESFTVNGTRGTLINESGLYSLIFSSKLPTAKQFKRWVTGEVLPAIRKTGRYETEEARFYEEAQALPPITKMFAVTRNGFEVQFFFDRPSVAEYIACVLKHRAPMKPELVIHITQSEIDKDSGQAAVKEVLIYRCENNYCEMFLIEEK